MTAFKEGIKEAFFIKFLNFIIKICIEIPNSRKKNLRYFDLRFFSGKGQTCPLLKKIQIFVVIAGG